MQVESKTTLNVNDLLGTKVQGSEAETENTEQGDFVFSDVLVKAVSGKESEKSSEVSETSEKEKNNEQSLSLSNNLETNEKKNNTSSSDELENLSFNKISKSNSKEVSKPSETSEYSSKVDKGLLTKSDLNLKALLSKSKTKDNAESVSRNTTEFEDLELTKTSNDKKGFLNQILGKVTKTNSPQTSKKITSSKAADLRINSEVHPSMISSDIFKKKNLGVNQYKKEINSLNKSLVRSPIHSELVENNKIQDENGFSKIHFTESSDQPISNDIEIVQNSDFGQSFDKQNENFSSGKVLDLSHIKAESKSSLIKEVSNYIEQSYVANQDSVDLVVKHDELGSFRIHAQKSGPSNQINLEINTASKQAEAFFQENESELIKNLQSGGVKLSSVKIVAKTEFLFTMEGGKSGNMEQSLDSGREQSFHGRGEQRSQSSSQKFSDGRNRREELWQQAQEFNRKYAA